VKWLTHKSGDIRDRVVFAWKPKKCADGFTRRFVFLNVRESFKEGNDYYEESDEWTPVRYTPLQHDAEAESEAAAAQLIRDARPKPSFILSGGFISGTISFGPTVEEGDEWKQPKKDEEEESE
jgi:hypothetical protein